MLFMKRILEIESGERIVDFKDNPLHIVSYSLPIDKVLTLGRIATAFIFQREASERGAVDF